MLHELGLQKTKPKQKNTANDYSSSEKKRKMSVLKNERQ